MSLLSIDVDAHLKKLAAHTYGSRYHYPVELVRQALARDAKNVSITIKPGLVAIRDNGRGIPPDQVQWLRLLVDPGQSPSKREKSIDSFLGPRGIGLLAIFSPDPARIVIENVFQGEGKTTRVEKGRILQTPGSGIKRGTEIQLMVNAGNMDQEKAILPDYCRATHGSITLNGKSIEKSSFLTHPLVYLKTSLTGEEEKGQIGIPAKGDLCRIWLLDQGIPWQHKIIPPWRGFIFEAALEHGDEIDENFPALFSGALEKLYSWLAKRYPRYPGPYKQRVEELLFKHNRLSGDPSLVNQFSPFKAWNSPRSYSLAEVSGIAHSKTLYAAIDNGTSRRLHPPAGSLHLTRSQMDFLVNHHRLPIVPVSYTKTRTAAGFLHRLAGKWRIILSKISGGKSKILEEESLTPGERKFINELERYIWENRAGSKDLHARKVHVRMAEARGWIPGVLKPPLLLVHRRHPLVKKSISAYERDKKNIEIAACLFL